MIYLTDLRIAFIQMKSNNVKDTRDRSSTRVHAAVHFERSLNKYSWDCNMCSLGLSDVYNIAVVEFDIRLRKDQYYRQAMFEKAARIANSCIATMLTNEGV